MDRARNSFTARRLTLTPLIDVIFLLLLFFMLTSTFTRFAEVPLVQAGAGGATEDAPPPLFLRMSDSGLTVNGMSVSGDVRETIDALIDDDDTTALLSVGDRVTSQQFVALMQELQSIDRLSVSVLR